MEDYGVAKGYLDLDVTKMESSVASAIKELEKIERKGALTESEFRKLESAGKGAGSVFQQMEQKSKALSDQLAQAKAKSALYKQEITNLNTIIARSKEEQTGLNQEIEKAKAKYEKAEAKVESLSGAYKAAQSEVKAVTKEYGENSDQAKEVSEKNEKIISTYEKAVVSARNYKNGLTQLENECDALDIEVEQSEQAIIEFKTKLNNTEASINSMSRELAVSKSKVATYGETFRGAGEKMQAAGDKMNGWGNKLSLGVTTPLTLAGTYAVKTAIDFESAFTGVTKTVDGTTEELDGLRQGIIDMSKEMPSSTTEISAVAEAAGQLGIQTPNILDFTRTMLDLGNSTNLSAEEGASALAKFANVAGMGQDKFGNLGSTVVDLGNHFATTEADIVAMGSRLVGAGTQVGMTEPQVLGFATALSSVGIEAEAGGTAFSTLMSKMQLAVEQGGDGLNQFAEVAGMSADEFKQSFEDDAAGAILSFVDGLSTCEDRGMSAIGVLDEMGLSDVRMRDALLRAAGASDVFTEAINVGTQAWDNNTALTEEAEKRYGTTASKMEISKNKIADSARVVGEKMMPAVADLAESAAKLAEKFAKLDPETQKTLLGMLAFAAGMGPVLKVTGAATQTVGGLTKGFGWFLEKAGKTSALKGAEKGLGGVATAAEGASAKTVLMSGATAALTTPLGLAVTAVGALAGGMYLASKAEEARIDKIAELTPKQQELVDNINKEHDAYMQMADSQEVKLAAIDAETTRTQNLADELRNLVDENGKIKSGNEDRVAFITGELSSALGQEISVTDGVVQKYGELCGSIDNTIQKQKALATQAAFQDDYVAATKKQAEAQEDYLACLNDVYKAESDLAEAQKRVQELKENNDGSKGWEAEYKSAIENVEGLKKKLDGFKDAASDARETMEGYNATVKNFEGLGAAIDSGDAAQIEVALLRIKNGFLTAEVATKESLTKQKDEITKKYKEMQEAIKNGEPGVTQEAVDAMGQLAEQSTAELEKKTAQEKKALADMFKQCGIEAPQALIDALADKDPEVQQTVIGLLDKVSTGTALKKEELRSVLEACGYESADSLVNALDGQKPNVQMKTLEMLGQMSDGVALQAPELYQTLADCGIQATDGLIQALALRGPEAQATAVTLLSQIHSGAALKAPEINSLMASLGISASGSLTSSLASKNADVQAKAINLLGQLQTADASKRGEIIAQLSTLGVEVGSSLSKGIKGSEGTVKNSANTAVDGLGSAANSRVGVITPAFGIAMQTMGKTGVQKMEDTVKNTKLSAPEMKDPDWNSEAKSGRSKMQTYLDENPLSITVNMKKGSSPGWPGLADGGYADQVSICGEAGPEMVIPLSAGKRSRALDLFAQTGRMLGVASLSAEQAQLRSDLLDNYYVQKGISDSPSTVVKGTDIDYKQLAKALADELRSAPIENNTVIEMQDGDVYLDNERVGRKQAPVISRIISKDS